jgi:predicted PhzF superfamily epimerase YddE/YHI9
MNRRDTAAAGPRIWQVDAFATTEFTGNPAGVCYLTRAPQERWMRQFAEEMNLSETAFLVPREGWFSIRYFTPAVEIPLCGHATLASAHVLFEEAYVEPSTTIEFRAPGGIFFITRSDEGWIHMDFPSDLPERIPVPGDFQAAFGFPARECYRSSAGLFAIIDDSRLVRDADPDLKLMVAGGFGDMAISASGDGDENGTYDFVSRMFAPEAGIDEDPVTGSIHLSLGQYWKGKTGRSNLRAYQASRRGGELLLEIGDERSVISGRARTVFRGRLAQDPS